MKKYNVLIIPLVFISCFLFLVLYFQMRTSGTVKEMQKIVSETAGDGYKLLSPENQENNIERIVIEVSQEKFCESIFFSECQKIKIKLCEFIKTHEEKFKLYSSKERERFSLVFVSSLDTKEEILRFHNLIEWTEEPFGEFEDTYVYAMPSGIHSFGELEVFFKTKMLLCNGVVLNDSKTFEKFSRLKHLIWITKDKDLIQTLKEVEKTYGFKVDFMESRYSNEFLDD